MTTIPFADLPLPPAQLANLASLGYRSMTPIQREALPHALAGQDLIAQAQTGSGKTAAFGIALLNTINPRDFGVQALVLCPTRELSTQVANEIRRLARYQPNIKVVTLCGGQPIGPQIGSLEHGAHIVVGTPGRIRDHLRKNTLSIARVKVLVLDEADRMLEMGFIDDMSAITEATPANRQTLLFSATYPDDIGTLSAQLLRNPIRIETDAPERHADIEQHFYICDKEQSLQSLTILLQHFQPAAAVVFCNTKQATRDVCAHLHRCGFHAKALHGDLEQRERDEILIQFRHRSCTLLVATDVAARGLDIEALPAVVNFQLPRDPETYIHRIGRTGRAGKQGLSLSLFHASEHHRVDAISAAQQSSVTFEAIETLSARQTPMAAPMVTLCIAAGRRNKVRPGDILGALTGEAGIPGDKVGKIDVLDYSAYVAIDRDTAGEALHRLTQCKIKGRNFKVKKL